MTRMHAFSVGLAVLVAVTMGSGCGSGRLDGAGAAGAAGAEGSAGGQGGQSVLCTFSDTYVLNQGQRLPVTYSTLMTLSPPAAFDYRYATSNDAGWQSCAPALPSCGDRTLVDVSDIEAAIALPDVQAAFAQAIAPRYGEQNVADVPTYSFTRADRHGFSLSIACTNSPSGSCVPTPSGVATLVDLLQRLLTQQLADPSCQGLASSR